MPKGDDGEWNPNVIRYLRAFLYPGYTVTGALW